MTTGLKWITVVSAQKKYLPVNLFSSVDRILQFLNEFKTTKYLCYFFLPVLNSSTPS